ncbi:hypothetical protein DSCO28_66720 [Desulfosarcina ovata subsp. sediminis]|uniref:histidine kinase n=1 Tax=Desulfosarcina ovata subsp. sediminis TaxID=885957 RepID=A0A5K8A102_9BACT|nr:response regulator [Desulfosarcina ovata]BBO86106.1 hypothetical protein DSCO28_66720 [Desulfosarcina ovata subsp. sediminis]
MTSRIDILLVEDNPGDADLIQEIVSGAKIADFHFTHAETLSDAIHHLKEKGTNLALLDLGLPDSSGLETVNRVRQAISSVPIVVLTGNDDEMTGMAAVKAGAQDYLVKGKVSGDLLARVFVYTVERFQHQNTLRESEQFLRSGLDALAAHIAILAPDGGILAVNRAWRKFAANSGALHAGGFINANYLDICDTAAADGEPAAAVSASGIRAVIDGVDDLFEYEYPCHGPEQERWFHVRVTPFPGSAPRRVVVAHEDITRRKRADQALKASEKQLRMVLDTSPNCVFILDSQGRYILVNQAIADLYGTTKSAMIGKTERDMTVNGLGIPGENDSSAGTSYSMDGTICYEKSLTPPDGNKRWFRIVQTPISLPETPDCNLFIALEVTDQRHAQEQLRNSELRLKTILDAQTSNITLLDTRMRVQWPNREACRSANMTRRQIIGKYCHEVWHQLPDICEGCPVVPALQDGEYHTARLTTPAGRTWHVLGCPVRNDAGHIVSTVVVKEDITERIQLESQLRQAQKMESLGTLAGGIAHDFNNILSAILGYTELTLLQAPEDAELKGNLKEVYQAGMRATDLVRQILTFSRRTDVELKPLEISIVIREALKLLRSTLPTSIEFRQRIDKNLDQVLADPTQIHQIVMNLCTNAGHAMEPRGGLLSVGLTQTTVGPDTDPPNYTIEPGQYLKLTVSDTGCGMTPEITASIFDPYFTTKDLGEGTGLGLSVVHGIVKEYGGEILVDSTPGKGSTFTLYLPTIENADEDSRQAGLELPPRGTERILVIDDEPPILKFTSRILEQQGYRVDTENDSLQALERFRAGPDEYDLILSDVTMPRLTGDRLAAEILAIRPDIPVILCTGYSRIVSEESARSIGVRALIAKPIVRRTLLSEIRKILDAAI